MNRNTATDAVDHDRLFKELLTTFFADFVALFLPDVAAYLDADSLSFLDKEIFTDVTSSERHEAAIVARARFKGEDAFFLVHVENQASAQGDFGRRMFRYFARLSERHALPVYPVVMFSYDAPRRPEPARYEVNFPGFTPLVFRYRVIQLNRLSWRAFTNRPNPVASALMAKMRIAPRDRPRVKLECLRRLATLKLDRARMQLISGFVDTYLALNAAEEQRFQARVAATLPPPEQETVMEIVTSWMREGMERGRQEGHQEGRQEGLEQMVARQLGRRLGTLGPELAARVGDLAALDLLDLGEALLDFSGPADLVAWLDRHSSPRRRA